MGLIKYKSCCFTGHRVLPREEVEDIRDMLGRAIEVLISFGCTDFISGGALGFDTLAAEAVIEARKTHPQLRLIMILPCRDQHKLWNDWSRRRYEGLLQAADQVSYVCERYIKGCMQARNKRMVEAAEYCIAYCNNPRSGTGGTIAYAKERGLIVTNLAE